MSYIYASDFPFKNFYKLAKQGKPKGNYQKQHWLSLETHILAPYQVKSFLYRTNAKAYTYNARAYSVELKSSFQPCKKPPLPLAQSIKLHIRALVLIPCHRCENLQENLAPLTLWSRNVTTSTREPTTCAWIRADICRQDGAICSKNRKIVPYHRCARFTRLMFSFPDYGSWQLPNIRFIDTKSWLLFQVWLPRPRLFEASERRASCKGDLLI